MRLSKLRAFLLVAISFAGGFGVGGLIISDLVMSRMDGLQSAAEARNASDRDALEQNNSTLRAAVTACHEFLSTGTVLYETTPRLDLAITGLRGLPVIPIGGSAQAIPRWYIPAKIKPLSYSDGPRAGVYYYVKPDPAFEDGRLSTEGPFVPEQVNPQ